MHFYWGRFSRGQYVNVILNLPSLPDSPPVAKFWNGTDLVLEELMPRIKAPTRTFRLVKMLDELFEDGQYTVVMKSLFSGSQRIHVGYFEVQGGTGSAPLISLMEIDRTLGRAVVSQAHDGEVMIGYKPKKVTT